MLVHRDRTVIAASSGKGHPRGTFALLWLLGLLFAQPVWSQATCTWNQNGPGTWDNPSNWSGCSGGNGSPAGTPGPADHAVIGAGAPLAEVDVGASALTVDRLSLSAGRVFGDADVTVLGRLEWFGGTIDGGGVPTALVLDSASSSDISGDLHVLAKRDLRIFGSVTWDQGDIELQEDAEIDIQGPFIIDYSGGIRGGSYPLELRSDFSPLARIHNSSAPGARIEILGDNRVVFASGVTFDNGNDVLVSNGTLQINGTGGDFGAYQIAPIAVLEFGPDFGVTRTLTGSSAVSGSGALHKFNEGTLEVTGGYLLTGPTEVVDGVLFLDTAADPLSLSDVRVRAPGILSSSGNLVVSAMLDWQGGEINGSGLGLTLTLPPGSTAAISLDDDHPAAYLRSRDLINQGNATLAASATVITHLWLDSANIDNQGGFTIDNNSAANQNLRLECAATNCGSFFNRSGATLTLIDQQGIVAIGSDLAAFDNAGLVELTQGCGAIGAPGTDTGTWRYAGSCTLWFNPRADTTRALQDSVVLDPIAGTALQLGGSVRVNGASRSFENLIIDPPATLFGPAAITLTGTTIWRGLIEGTSPGETLTVAAGAVLQTSGNPSDQPLLFARTLFNDGDINIADAHLRLDGGAEIRNSNLLNLLGTSGAAGGIVCATPPLCGLLTNTGSGSIQSIAFPAGPATQIDADITVANQGALRVDNGVLNLEGPFTAASGSLVEVFPGAGLRRQMSPLVLAAGTLRGAGVIDADVQADALDIEPGGSAAGNLTILGDFTATVDTRYSMGIAGTLPPAATALGERPAQPAGVPSYDRLTIAGSASLDGTLDVVDLGYSASGSDVFDLMLYASRTGSVLAGTNPFSGVGLNLQQEPTRIRLAAAAGGGCEWNPAGGGPNNWTNPAKWNNCSGGVGPGPGPAGTPGAPDTAIIGGGSNVNLDVPVTVAELQFTGGTVLGSNNLTISNALIWTGGTFQGESGSMVTLSSGALGTLSGGQHNIDGRTFLIQGTANWTTGLIQLANSGVLEIAAGGVLNSNPSLAFESIFGTVGVNEVRNNGVIVKLGPNYSGIGQSVRYSGVGAINVTAGDFTFAATSLTALNGSYTAAGGSTLQFVGGSRSFGPSATLDGGTLVFGDSGAVAVNTVQTCIGSASTVIIRNAELVLDCAGPSDLAGLQMPEPLGVLEGSSAIRVTGSFGWGHGTIRGSGLGQTFEIAPAATAQFDAPQGDLIPRTLSNRRLRNDGTIAWIATNTTEVNDGGEFANELGSQLFLAGSGARSVTSNAPATSRMTNNGAMIIDDGAVADLDVLFDNAGSVQLNNGELRVRRNGNDLGSYSIGSSSLLYFDGAVRSMGPGSDVSGGGGVRVIGGASVTSNGTFQPHDLRIESGGLVQIDSASPQTLQTLFLQNGTLTGNAEIRIGTRFDWRHAGVVDSVGASPGPLVIQSGALLELCGGLCTLSNRVLRIEGMADWGGGVVEVPAGAAAKIVVASGGTLQTDSFKSAARYRCAAPTCTVEMEVEGSLLEVGDGAIFELTSPLLVNGGLLSIDGSFMQAPGVTMSDGAIAVDSYLTASPVVLNGGVLRGTGYIDGNVDNIAGRVQPGASPGRISIGGSYFQGPAGILDIQVGGLSPGVESDYVDVTFGCSIDGSLNVTNAGFPLTVPSTLDFLGCGYGLSGVFSTTNIAYPGYQVDYGPSIASLVPGGGPLVVNSIGDAGDGICDVTECTLRDALIAANLMPDPDVIEFDIPAPQCVGAGSACVIAPTSPLPAITGPVIIDGYSQPGASPNLHPQSLGLGSNAVLTIELDGNLVSGSPGLVVNAPSALVTIAGLSIYRFGTGIVTQGPGDSNYQILGNFLGLRADGSAAPSGQQVGVSIQGGNTLIGNGAAFGMNVISSNAQQGISILSIPPLASLLVQGNLIGTAPNGVAALGNGLQGIGANTSSSIAGIFIGGDLPDERNVISGNLQDGIRFQCSASVDNCFDGARIIGNFIGLAVDGNPLGNLGNGVNLSAMNGGLVYIGGINPGEGNRIAFNGGNGILATFGGLGRASFVRNGIYLNGQQGIDLGGDGRTANDVGDGDTGTNGLLNFPSFSSYSAPGGDSAIIDVVLDTPDIGGNYPARVDFYTAVEDEPGVWLGTTTCSAPAVNCPASFAFPGGVTVAPDDVVLGIVTDGFGKSSEASFYATATTVSAPDGTIGTPYTATVEVAVAEPFTALGTVEVDDGNGESCVASLSEIAPGLSGGSCSLDALAPAGARTLTATYAPETAPRRPFSNSNGTDGILISGGAAPVVNSVADPGDGNCDLAECTLREAIALANLTLAPDVNFDSVLFAVPRTITLTAGELVSTQDLNINGPTAAGLVISGNNLSRILYANGVDVSVSNLSFTGGNSVGSDRPGVGGAILHSGGNLTLTDVVLGSNGCTASGTGGAMAVTFGMLNATRVSVTGNTCDNVGGIYLQDGDLTLVDSSLTGNSGTEGEALRVTSTFAPLQRAGLGSATAAALTNVTISDNSTTIGNAAIRSEPLSGAAVSLTLTNVTVSGNTTSSAGGHGAIWHRPIGGTHSTLLRNSIVAGNNVGGLANDIEGTADASSSFNVIGTGGGLAPGANGNFLGINAPLLAPLANYGGNTLTRALLPGSPAIDRGSNALAPAFDQRGIARPQLGTADVGAFESRGFALSVVSGTPQTTFTNTSFALPLVVAVVPNAAGEPVDGGQLLYSAPGAGASAIFSNPAIISAGEATMVATANSIAGSYAVTASAIGATGTPSFALTNGCPPTVVTNGGDSGAGTLRQTIADACPGSVVTFAGGVASVALTSGELVIGKNLTLDGGAGVAVTRQAGSPDFRVFRVTGGANVLLDSLTISGGNVADDGGGIQNFGNLTVLDSLISGNASTAGNGGGGIANYGTLTVDNTTIELNTASFAGGAIVLIDGGSATLSDCTLSGNSALQGGAVLLQSVTTDADMTISNCTISGNTASLTAAAVINVSSGAGTSSTLSMVSSTVAGNSGPSATVSTGVNAGSATTTLRNNIYAANSADNVVNTAPGVTTSLGNNLSDDATGGGGPGDLVNTDPLLAALGNYGGVTRTHALLPGSPAIDAGSASGLPATDQRGVPRPQLGAPDIGAFESRGFVLSTVSGSPQSTAVNAPFALPLVVGVTANVVTEPVNGGQVSFSAPVSGASAMVSSPATIAGAQASVVATANGIVGSYAVTATAIGASGTPSFALTNGLSPTSTTITGIAPNVTVVGEPYSVSVSVSDGASPVTTGTVEVRQLSDGVTCSIDLASASSCQLAASNALTTSVRASYLGGGAFAPSQSAAIAHVVERADTVIQIVSDTPDPSPVGATIAVTVDLDVVAPGAGSPQGEILVTDGIASCSIALPDLSCQLIPKAVGPATLEARYLGDANFNASVDTEPHTFTAEGADLAIIKRNGLRLIPGGAPSTYVLLVSNAGPQAVVNARVTDILPAQFSNASWTCSASGGASCPASGAGNVDTLVSLPSGSSVVFALTATAQIAPEQVVTNRATVSPPANAPDPVPGNNESIDIDPIGVFGEGFETEDE